MQNYISILLTSNDLGKRIDLLLANQIDSISRNRLKSLILDGNLKINNKIINQPSFKIKETGKLELIIPKPKEYKLKPQDQKLKIIYEDENLIVINKMPGIVVHPGSGNYENTVVNGLLYHCKDNLSGIGGILRPGVVHRIDKMTSGVLVFAKDDITHNSLSEQFKIKSTHREYDLLVWNDLTNSTGLIETNITRSKLNRKKMSVTSSEIGKKAITGYKLVKSFKIDKKITINHIKCELHTGRTHQIRVHMSYIGNPILGDRKYSRNNYYFGLPDNLRDNIFNMFVKIERQALHARSLGFFHPFKKKNLLFKSELPDDIKKLLNILNKY